MPIRNTANRIYFDNDSYIQTKNIKNRDGFVSETKQVFPWNDSVWTPQILNISGNYQIKIANFTATGGCTYFLGANNIEVTLPSFPVDKTRICLIWIGSGCTIVPFDSQKIMGANEVFNLDVYPYSIQLVYISSQNDWRIAA